MQSRQNGDFKRSVLSALATIVAIAVPSLLPATALAEQTADHKPAAAAVAKDAKAPAKHEGKRAKKTRAAKAHKPAKKGAAHAAKAGHAKADARSPKSKKVKKTASRSVGAKKKAAKKADAEAPRRRCHGAPISIVGN